MVIDARGEDMFRRVLNGIAIILTYINLSKVRRASWNHHIVKVSLTVGTVSGIM